MNKKLAVHPIVEREEEIEAEGLLVFEDMHRFPLYDEPYTSSYLSICLNISGWSSGEYDMRPVRLEPHDIMVLMPGRITCAHESSTDYRCLCIVMSPAFQEELKRRMAGLYRDNCRFDYHHNIHLSDAQFETALCSLQLIRDVSQSDSPLRLEMLCSLIQVLFQLLMDFRRQNGMEEHRPSPREELFCSFYQAVENNYRKSREVKFYADLLCMTPKHFSTVIKTHTGISAIEWINSYVTIQAKSMLRHQPQLNVQQIAQQMGFPDQATFSRYFRNNTGLSPSEFRDSNK